MILSTRVCFRLVALGVVSLGALHCSSKTCTELGCADSATVSTSITATVDELPQLTITVCHGGDCASGTPAVTQQTCGASAISCPPPLVQCKLSGTVLTTCSLAEVNATAPSSVPHTVSLEVGFLIDQAKLADGDIYTVRVNKQGVATPLIDLTRTATYTTSKPNGEDCAPTCKNASLD